MDCFLCCCWSPTHVSSSPFYGCLLATVSSHHYIEIYTPSEDPTSDEWIVLTDVSMDLPIHAKDMNDYNQLAMICISWSQKCQDHSFIAVGSKSGTVSIFKFHENKTIHSLDIRIADNGVWITQLAWSKSWIENKTMLAMSLSDGTLHIYTLEFDGKSLNSFANPTQDICLPDSIPITCFSWFDSSQLVFTKGNQLFILKLSLSHSSSIQVDSLFLSCQMGASGIVWDSNGCEIRIYSMDGSCFLISLTSDSYLSVVDDSPSLRNTLLQQSQGIAAMEEEEEDQNEPQSSQHSWELKTLLFGACTSSHSLFDCVLYS